MGEKEEGKEGERRKDCLVPLIQAEMIEESTISDDFTFPTIVDNSSPSHFQFAGFAASSLWYSPSSIPEFGPFNAEKLPEGDLYTEQKSNEQKAFLLAEDASSIHGDEEKMDILWEGLNDELDLHPSCCNEDMVTANGSLTDSADSSESDAASPAMAKFCSMQSLKMSKNARILQRRSSSLLVILKVLRKLFCSIALRVPREHDTMN